jgi:hypothetical protein
MPNLAQRGARLATVVFHPTHLRRTGTIALAVGTWLTLVNQGDVLFSGVWSAALAGKIVLNYLTPFTVSNLGLLSRTFQHSAADGAPHL